MKKINKILGLFFLILILLSVSTLAYYTNIGKWLEEQKNPYLNGEGQQRLAEDFILNGCGTDTILDTVTGLCWDKNLNKGSGIKQWATSDSYPEPVWTGSSYNYGVYTAADYPAFQVCDTSTTGSNTDWRMPTRAELLTLIDETGGYGATCTTLLGFGFTNCQNDYYWSSNQRGSLTTNAFLVYLDVGDSGGNAKTGSAYVACVRRD